MSKPCNKATLAMLWLILTLGFAVLAMSQGVKLNSSILALLPSTDQQPLIKQATEQMSAGYSDRVAVLISGTERPAVARAIKKLAAELDSASSVANTTWHIDPKLESQAQQLFPYRFALLGAQTRQRLLDGQAQAIEQQALAQAISPMSAGSLDLIRDPFGLFQQRQLERTQNLAINPSDDCLAATTAAQPTCLLLIELRGDAFSPATQQQVMGILDKHQQQLQQQGIQLRSSGMLIHAAAGAEQAEAEITTIGLGSLIGITLLVILVFRRTMPLLQLLLPVIIGSITAASATLLAFGQIHVITLSFGAGLVGVAIDYAMHYLCERQIHTPKQLRQRLLPGLALGLLSSVAAYAALALAPFPGLRQMAFFTVIGLTSAWISVWLLLPWLTQNTKPQPLAAANWLKSLFDRMPKLQQHRGWQITLALLVMAGSYSLWHSQGQDDIRLLQTSPPELINADRYVQETLNSLSSSQFLIISGADMEAVLQREEQLRSYLDHLQIEQPTLVYRALSQTLPSRQHQFENLLLAEQLYQQLEHFYNTLGLSQLTPQAQQQFEASKQLLTLADLQQLSGTGQWQDLLLQAGNRPLGTIIRLSTGLDAEAQAAISALSDAQVQVLYVDRISLITDIMSSYRTEITEWVIMAYLLIFAVLLLRYRRDAWRVALPSFVAAILTLAVITQLEQGLNLFNLMALILVLGIGLDMGIMQQETQGASHTYLAISLSAITSLLAFGLLSLSQTPVLHHFGSTVLIGLLLVWMLTPMMRKPEAKPSEAE